MIRKVILGIAALGAVAVTATAIATQVISNKLVLIDRSGRPTVLGTLPIDAFAPRLSADGQHLVYSRSGGSLWMIDIRRATEPRRIPALPDAQFVAWDGTGERIFYIAAPGANQALFFTRTNGSGYPSVPLRDPARAPDSWSDVHNGLSFITLDGDDYDVWFYSETEKRAVPLVVIAGSRQLSSHISPDGRWLAYKSDETGRFEIWVQSFPSGERVQVTKNGGNNPVWSADGGTLYFDDNRQLFRVDIRAGTPLTFSPPQPLPVTNFLQGGSLRRQWNVTPEGRFLVMQR